MPWICKECREPINLLTPTNPDGSPAPDTGEPLYRKQTFMVGKRIIVEAYCGPECSKVAYEKTKANRK